MESRFACIKNTWSIHLFLLFVMFMVAACTIGRVTISILEPAPVTLPSSMNRVSIYNEPLHYDSIGTFDSVRFLELDPDFDYNVIRKGFMLGLYDALAASPRYRKVVINDSVYGLLSQKSLISWDDLDQICTHDTTNTIVLLLSAVTYDSMYTFVYPDFRCYLDYRIINKTNWLFYQSCKNRQLLHYSFSDTIYFPGREFNCESLLKYVANADELLFHASYYTGEMVGNQFSPSWNDNIKRIFYKGLNRKLSTAGDLVMKDRWREAAAIWDRLSEEENTKVASKASFNLAVAYERDDDLDQAISWLAYANALHGNKRIMQYRKILDNRLRSREILNEQIPGYGP